jgi:hypothetical protein
MTWTHPVGITWLAPVVGAVFLRSVREEGKGLRALLGALGLYALGSRAVVALLMVGASTLRLGSHYDLSRVTKVWFWGAPRTFEPGSAEQILYLGVIPQLTFWVGYTVMAGLVGAGFAAAFLWARRGPTMGLMTPSETAAATRRAET